jgi:membrane protein YdbS with pleckstrin-like domain
MSDTPAGFAGIERYLLPTETQVIAVRRHWAQLLEPALTTVAGLLVLFWLDNVMPLSFSAIRTLLLVGWLVLAVRLVWKLLEWREDWFVVTDRRLLLRSGLITRRIGMMPLMKVTDMSYSRPPVGRILGYGEIVLESAGQDQALRTVKHLPDPDGLYLEICELLFGPRAPVQAQWRAAVPPPPPSPAEPDPPYAPDRPESTT